MINSHLKQAMQCTVFSDLNQHLIYIKRSHIVIASAAIWSLRAQRSNLYQAKCSLKEVALLR
ncbi:MAG TPA: hypothetical protein DE179_13865 [Oceanospirillaceae bacterium]|nr:hypothetical protein [Oceanospirillaceae bacterium]